MKTFTTLFVSSFAIAAVAGWSHLDAGPEADGPAVKPALREATLGGVKLRASLDRDRVPVGETPKLTLAAIEPGHAAVDLEVRVLEQSGNMMSRSMPPPREVANVKVRLGDQPVSLPLALTKDLPQQRGRAPATDPMLVAGRATQYTIVVSAVKPSDHDDGLGLPVFAYVPPAIQLTVDAPVVGKVGADASIDIHVKNLASKPIEGVQIGVSTTLFEITDSPRIESLTAGAETVVHVHGKLLAGADAAAQIYASASAQYGGSASVHVSADLVHGTIATVDDAALLASINGLNGY